MTEKKINAPYDNPFGIWHVTTEGDCEGRSPRDLGFNEGYIDEIALALADKCFYSLYFVAINIHSLDMTPTRKTVITRISAAAFTFPLLALTWHSTTTPGRRLATVLTVRQSSRIVLRTAAAIL